MRKCVLNFLAQGVPASPDASSLRCHTPHHIGWVQVEKGNGHVVILWIDKRVRYLIVWTLEESLKAFLKW